MIRTYEFMTSVPPTWIPRNARLRGVKVHLTVATLMFFLSGITVEAQVSYQPPSVISATDAFLPYQNLPDGFVVLDVSLDSDGSISSTDLLRDPGSMVSAAISSVRTWKFKPASAGNTPRPSEMTVAFVYRPADFGGRKPSPPKSSGPVLPPRKADAQRGDGYVPAGIITWAYPDYPVNSTAWGSVVIQVSLDKSGTIQKADVLRKQEPFTSFAVEALKRWSFQPATLHGKPADSQLAIAFVFQVPYSEVQNSSTMLCSSRSPG